MRSPISACYKILLVSILKKKGGRYNAEAPPKTPDPIRFPGMSEARALELLAGRPPDPRLGADPPPYPSSRATTQAQVTPGSLVSPIGSPSKPLAPSASTSSSSSSNQSVPVPTSSSTVPQAPVPVPLLTTLAPATAGTVEKQLSGSLGSSAPSSSTSAPSSSKSSSSSSSAPAAETATTVSHLGIAHQVTQAGSSVQNTRGGLENQGLGQQQQQQRKKKQQRKKQQQHSGPPSRTPDNISHVSTIIVGSDGSNLSAPVDESSRET